MSEWDKLTACWEHPDQDQICVVDPLELVVASGVEAGVFEHGDAAFSQGEVGFELVVDVFGLYRSYISLGFVLVKPQSHTGWT